MNVEASSITARADSTATFQWLHAWLPAIACAFMLALFSLTNFDTALARAVFFAPGHGWLGADTWWADDFLHTGGRDVIRLLALATIVTWVLGRFRWSSRHWWSLPQAEQAGAPTWSSTAGYVAISIALTVGLAGLLKTVTNVDCPWDLSLFNGTRPYVHVFGDRLDSLPPTRCYPGAHAASGFALLSLYFAFRDYRRRLAVCGLLLGLAIGAVFSFVQQARGAHFLSHDLASAFLSWFVSLSVYLTWQKMRATRQ